MVLFEIALLFLKILRIGKFFRGKMGFRYPGVVSFTLVKDGASLF